ncbi:MAG: RluA family pseudouridine synthase [Acidobacteriaceae bacterium]
MPSKNMLPKGHRHRSVRAEYVATRGVDPLAAPTIPTIDLDLYENPSASPATHTITTPAEAEGLRIDQYLARAIPEISRSRVQLLIEHGQVQVNGVPARPKHKLTPGETILITGAPRPAPLNATPENIPLDIVFEDDFLAVVNKPAGMMVHAGAAAARPDANLDDGEEVQHDPRSAGTLVNALLHHFNHHLSSVGGDLRPGIVHRLDKQTSGLLVVAKDDTTHRKLGEAFAQRQVAKTYLALVHGHIPRRGGARTDDTTVSLPIGRDIVRRTRMTTRRSLDAQGVRSAVSHVHVLERLSTPYGLFTLVEVKIETGRTHQIRVHLQSMGHPVAGDTLYGAPRQIRLSANPAAASLCLTRNFLHAARLSFLHPRSGEEVSAEAALPTELTSFLEALRTGSPAAPIESTG